MSRHDGLYLTDMRRACEKVIECAAGLDRPALEKEWIRLDAILRNLEILGEAAKCLSEPLRQQHPEIPWRKIGAMRDIIIHHYFGVDMDVVWDTVKNRVPELLSQLRTIEAGSGRNET